MTSRIDAHQHFWRLSRGDYGWLRADDAALAPLYRDIEPDELRPLLQRHGIAQTVVVQAAPSVAETRFLLALAQQHPWIAAVVGWVDLAHESAPALLRELAQVQAFKGVRPMLQDLPDPGWIARAPRAEAIAALHELGLVFDALVRLEHLPALQQWVARHPGLPVVIDHAAKPPLQRSLFDAQWARGIAELARHPQVHCKLSGLLTEWNPSAEASVDDLAEGLRPLWRHLLDCFGPERLMWGSDWPVLNLAGDYDRWVAVTQHLLDELPPAQRQAVWAGNAASVYRITTTSHHATE